MSKRDLVWAVSMMEYVAAICLISTGHGVGGAVLLVLAISHTLAS